MMASLDIGIDLGTSNMIAGNRKDGILIREPTIVAQDSHTGKVLGVGSEVKKMIGREYGSMKLISPMENGVISNYAMTQVLVRTLFKKVGRSLFFKPRVIACIPSGVTGLEAQTMVDTLMEAGARDVLLMQEPVASALGAGVDITRPHGNLVMDIGGGTTDVAVITLGGVASSASTLSAGNAIDRAIIRHLRQQHNVIIGAATAEQVKIQLASIWHGSPEATMEVKGRGVVTGLPTKILLSRSDLYPSLLEISDDLVRTVSRALENTPPELSGDISTTGLYLTGGGAMLTGMKEMLEERVRVPVNIPDIPLDCALAGTLISFDYWGEPFDGFYDPRPSYRRPY